MIEVFVENFLAGTIKVDFFAILKETGTSDKELDSFGDIVNDIRKWYVAHTEKNSPELKKQTEPLFRIFTNGRALGVITGVLKEIPQLEQELEECGQDNILLAQDSKDKERIIARYEAGMIGKK